MGTVMVRSTSVGDSPGAFVSTATWIVDVSGIASIGSRAAAKPPHASSTTKRMRMPRRNRTVAVTSLANMGHL
jgi:hypothetical protein